EKISASENPDEAIANLVEWINCYSKQVSRFPKIFFDDGGRFIKQCHRKIEQLKKLKVERSYNATDMHPQEPINAVANLSVEKSTRQGPSLLQYGYSQEQVLNYFLQLTKYYPEEQVMCFLKANFEGF